MNTGEHLLHIAAQNGNVERVKGLLEDKVIKKPIDVDARDTQHMNLTPLMRAAEYGHLEIVQILLTHKARLDLGDNVGRTPVHIAAIYGQPDILQVLIDAGGDKNIRDSLLQTPLTRAADMDEPECIKVLLENGADVDLVGPDGWTPLIFAVERGNVQSVQYLLEFGADPNIRGKKGEFTLNRAIKSKNTEIVKLLVEYGADIGQSLEPLITFADKHGNPEIKEYLEKVSDDPIAHQVKALPKMMKKVIQQPLDGFKEFLEKHSDMLQRFAILGQIIPLFEQLPYEKQKVLYPAIRPQIGHYERQKVESMIRDNRTKDRTV